MAHKPEPVRDHAGPAGRWLETIALAALLLVVAMRPLLTETYDLSLTPIAQALDTPAGLTPAATAWFDGVIWLAATATALAAWRRRAAWRWTGLEVGWLLTLAGAVLSTAVASNQRLAIGRSAGWLTAFVLAAALANLCRDRRRIMLVLAVLAASATASAVRCGMQVGVEFDDTWEHYQQIKPAFWQRQGVPLDDSQIELYERRMRAHEATGFFALSNMQGAYLAMAGLATLAAAVLGQRGPGSRLFLAVLAALLMASIMATGSRGALLAALALLCVLVAVWLVRERLRRRWLLLLAAGWLAVGAAVVGVVGYGRSHGGLPGSSLGFRWQYWEVTSQIIADRFFTGVGAGNFDRAYLTYKPIDYPEEIRDPHNFILSAFAQWGVLGGAGLLAAMLGGSIAAAGRWGRHQDPDEPPAGGIPAGWIVGLPIAFVLLRLLVLGDLFGSDQSGWAMIIFDLGLYGLLWCTVFADLCWMERWSAPGAGGDYRLPLMAAVGAFLLANTIDFSLLEPGTLTVFAAIVGLLLAAPAADHIRSVSAARRIVPVAVCLAGTLAFGLLVFRPAVASAHWLAVARHAQGPAAISAYQAAAAADPLDPAPLVELAEHAASSADMASLNRAVDAVNDAILRDPDRLNLYRYRMNLLEARYRAGGAASDLLGAIGAARRCVEMYETSPDHHLALAELLDRANADMDSPHLRAEAIAHYREALRLNDARPGTDEVRRWSAQRAAEIRKRLQDLEADATRPASSPATRP